MMKGQELIKDLISRWTSPRFQHALRRFYLAREVARGQPSQERESAVLGSLVGRGDMVADVGANVGVYTVQLSCLVGVEGRVYAFEPLAENHAILEKVVRRARLSNVRLFHAALGPRRARREMAIPELPRFRGYYRAHFAGVAEAGRRRTVDVVTLDDLRMEGVIPRLDFAKCDVEGGELEVIQGGLQVIRSDRPAWLMEVSRATSDEVFRVLAGFGYRAFVYDGTLVPTERYQDGRFSNYFFLHPESRSGPRVMSPS